MKAPIEHFESTMYGALAALRGGRWQAGLAELEQVEHLCRQHSFPEALPHVLANQLIALQHLGRDQMLHQRWTELLTLLQSGTVAVDSYQSLGPILHYFAEHPSGGGYGKEWLNEQSLDGADQISTRLDRTVGQAFSTSELAEVHPAVLGAALAMNAAFSKEDLSVQRWSAPLIRQFGSDEQPDAYLNLIALLDATPPEVGRIYRCLCTILEQPKNISPVVYFLSWLTAMRLEDNGLPKKLAFSPNPPQELRLLHTLRMMNSLADALEDVPGYEGVLHAIWRAVHTDVEALNSLINARRDRGGKKSADVEVFAEIACWRSMVCLYAGNDVAAVDSLSSSADIARKQALNSQGTATKILRLQAEIYERQGRRREARLSYLRCVYLVFPKFDSEGHLHVFDEGIRRLTEEPEALLNGMLALAGWIRLSEVSLDRLSLYVYDLLSLLPEGLSYRVRSEGGANLLLALAYQGHAEAAMRAEVWAHASGRNSLTAVSLAYRVLLDESMLESLSTDEIQRELDAVEALPAGELRQSVQLLIAEAVLGRRVRSLRPTAETLIRRAGITLCSPRLNGQGGRCLLLLPCRWQNSLWTIIETAMALDLSTSLRPLLASIARHGLVGPAAQPNRTLAVQLSTLAEQAIDGFGQSGMIDVETAERTVHTLTEHLVSTSTRLPRLERPRGREAFLECYQVDGHWLFLVISSSGGILLVPNEHQEGEVLSAWLAGELGSYLKAGSRIYVVHSLPKSAIGFEMYLGAERAIDVVYGYRPPSKRLVWNSSLSIQMIGDRWTSTDLGALRQAARKGISIEMCLEQAQFEELTPAQWMDTDVVLLGLARTDGGGLSLWDGGGPINISEIAFSRGENRNGLCVLLTPEQTAVHAQALELAEYFEGGVIVIAASERSLEVVGKLISRSSLLLEPVDVITYLGKSYRDLGTDDVRFCTLYTSALEL